MVITSDQRIRLYFFLLIIITWSYKSCHYCCKQDGYFLGFFKRRVHGDFHKNYRVNNCLQSFLNHWLISAPNNLRISCKSNYYFCNIIFCHHFYCLSLCLTLRIFLAHSAFNFLLIMQARVVIFYFTLKPACHNYCIFK